jgi:hypothetical protein
MARYQATIPSARPAPETFDYLATFSNAAQWDPGVLSAEQLDPGPVRRGTRFRLVVPFLGRQLTLSYETRVFDAPRLVILDLESPLLRGSDRISVTPGEGSDRSTVSYDAEVWLRGPLRVLDPALRSGFNTAGSRAAAGLTRVLAGPSGAVPG